MAVNVSVPYNDGSLPDILLLTKVTTIRELMKNAMKGLYFKPMKHFYTRSRISLRTCKI